MIIVFLAKYLILVFPLFLIYLLYKQEYASVLGASIGTLLTKLIEIIFGRFANIPRPFVLSPQLPHYDEIINGPFSRFLGENRLIVDSSFFSNHAAIAFVISTVIYLTYGKKSGMILLIIASLVAMGRVLANVHYMIDVAGGAALGIAVGLTVSNLCVKLLR